MSHPIPSDLLAVGISSRAMLAEQFRSLKLSPSTAQNYATQYLRDPENSVHAEKVATIIKNRRAFLARPQTEQEVHRERLERLRDLGIVTRKDLISALEGAGYDKDAAEMYAHRFLNRNPQAYVFRVIEAAALKYHDKLKAAAKKAPTVPEAASASPQPATPTPR